jgi:hypothetical protein
VFHIFAHLKKYHNPEIVYDPSDPVIDEAQFDTKDWASSEFGHLDGEEKLPPNMSEPIEQGFVISSKVDTDHALTLSLVDPELASLCGSTVVWFSY